MDAIWPTNLSKTSTGKEFQSELVHCLSRMAVRCGGSPETRTEIGGRPSDRSRLATGCTAEDRLDTAKARRDWGMNCLATEDRGSTPAQLACMLIRRLMTTAMMDLKVYRKKMSERGEYERAVHDT